MLIYVTPGRGRLFELDVEASDTIGNVKARISTLFPKSSPCLQRLTHGTRWLAVNRTLSYYDIQKGSTLVIRHRWMGGPTVVQHERVIVSSTPLPLEENVVLKPTIVVAFGTLPSMCPDGSVPCSLQCPFRPFPIDLNWYCGGCKCDTFGNTWGYYLGAEGAQEPLGFTFTSENFKERLMVLRLREDDFPPSLAGALVQAKLDGMRYNFTRSDYYGGDTRSWQRYTRHLPYKADLVIDESKRTIKVGLHAPLAQYA